MPISFHSHLHSVRVPHHKDTANIPIIRMDTPRQVVLPMSQQIGAFCEPLVRPGDYVRVGQLVADSSQQISAPIHASVSGTVKEIRDFTTVQGAITKAIVIEADGLQTPDPAIAPPRVESFDDFIAAVRRSGLVGLGGAGFPSHAKLMAEKFHDLHTLVVNAAECEPYITADHRSILERRSYIFSAIRLVMQHLKLDKTLIGIEDNKPDAISYLKERETPDIRVCPLRARYPRGGEKVLLYELAGIVVAEGKLPADYGVLVMNVSSLAFLGRYFATGMPLVERWITVAGSAVAMPQNLLVPLGASYRDVIEFCGGYRREPGEVFMGGPMMGIDVCDDDFPVLKNNNAIIALAREDIVTYAEDPCVNCGKCISACPFDLMPCMIDRAVQVGDIPALKRLKANLCMECGCCAYVCPAKRQLVLSNKLAKLKLREAERRSNE